MQSYDVKQRTYESWIELRRQNKPLQELLNTLCGLQWYRLQNNSWRFWIKDGFNPYRIVENPHFMTDAQAMFFALNALGADDAQKIPFKEYIKEMSYRTTTIYVKDCGEYTSLEVPEAIEGWLNGIYIGVDLTGRSNA